MMGRAAVLAVSLLGCSCRTPLLEPRVWGAGAQPDAAAVHASGGCRAGTTPVEIGRGPAGPVGSLAIDEAYAYFTISDPPALLRAPLGGGAAEPLATLVFVGPRSVAVDEAAIYFANHEGVARLPKSAPFPAEPQLLAQGRSTAVELVLEGDFVLWLNASHLDEHAVMRTPRAGGDSVQLAALPDYPQHLALQSDRLLVSYLNVPGVDAVPTVGGLPDRVFPQWGPLYGLAAGRTSVCATLDDGVRCGDAHNDFSLFAAGGSSGDLTMHDDDVWFSSEGAGPGSGRVLHKQVNDGSGQSFTELATGQLSPGPVAVDGRCVYWGTADGVVHAVAR